MELKYIEQFSNLPDTILTEPVSNLFMNTDVDIVHIDVDEDCIADFADFALYDYKISSVHISVYKGFTTVLIRIRKYAPKEKNL